MAILPSVVQNYCHGETLEIEEILFSSTISASNNCEKKINKMLLGCIQFHNDALILCWIYSIYWLQLRPGISDRPYFSVGVEFESKAEVKKNIYKKVTTVTLSQASMLLCTVPCFLVHS